jgi:hypothetical protein
VHLGLEFVRLRRAPEGRPDLRDPVEDRPLLGDDCIVPAAQPPVRREADVPDASGRGCRAAKVRIQ